MIAMAVVAMLTLTFMSSLAFVKTQRYRDRDAGVVTGFLSQYVEHIKALPLDQLKSGRPLNALYDGTAGGPLIPLPASGQWVSLAGNEYLLMHPDLVWLRSRSPELRLTLSADQANGVVQTAHAEVELRWAQPLSSRMLTNRLDIVRVRDV